MRPYCKLVPTGSLFVVGLIILVYGSHWIFTEAINNSDLKKSRIDLSLTGTRLSLAWWGIKMATDGGKFSKAE